MKKLMNIVLAVILVLTPVLLMTKAQAVAGPNLVANPSVETADPIDPTQPTGWLHSGWGTNTSKQTYVTGDARTGTKSLKTEMTAYTDGDAKWYFAPVDVEAGAVYKSSGFYKSTVSSEIVAAIEAADGNYSYQWLATVAASASWREYSAEIVAPAGAKKITIMHVFHQVGWLQTDDTYFGLADDGTGPVIPPAGTNLIPNASMETIEGTAPIGWNNNTWGSNTAKFTVETNGQNGSRSVKTTVSNYANGDAKWYFAPVDVQAGAEYTYTHYYKASAQTQIIAALVDASGNYTYRTLQTLPASNAWLPVNASFTTSPNTKKVTILHIVTSNGWLQIDNASLIQTVATTNPVPNPSLETVSGGGPAGWQSGSWGNLKATFQHVNEGHTGSKSVKVTISNYKDGDAKWLFNPTTSVVPGKQYRFTAWYKSNVAPKAVAMFTMSDGSTRYFGMPNPMTTTQQSSSWWPFPSAPSWQKYTDTFTVPQGAVSASAFMFIDQNGWLQTDDYSLEAYQPVGFSRPLVTLTFDDGHEDNVTNALPLMEQYGIKSTQCYATDHVEGNAQNTAAVKLFFDKGHEICSHTVSHPFLTKVSASQLRQELQRSKSVLENITKQPVRNFASPYGDYNAAVINEIDNYYQSHRTVDEGYNSKDNFNIYRLRVQNLKNTTTLAEFQSWLDQARATNTWLILVYHRVANDAEQFDTYKTDFAQQLQALQASGLTIKTYQGALDEVRPQL